MKVSIIKFDHFGRGIGKINEKIVFVNRALPGEIVDVSVFNEKKNYLEGNIKGIIKEVNTRIKPICPYYDKCGGCNFLHTTYEVEKEFKTNKAKELLGKCDKFYETSNLNYRNKVTLHVKNKEIGFYEEKTDNIVNIDYCYLYLCEIPNVSMLGVLGLGNFKFSYLCNVKLKKVDEWSLRETIARFKSGNCAH